MKQIELEKIIKEAQEAYYEGNPVMSDSEFDDLWDELLNSYPNSELLKNVGADNTDGFVKAQHFIPMGSQSKANTEEEMQSFFTKNPGKYIADFKMDGASIELVYKNGKFAQAITRGDGKQGDDITKNAKKMNFPKSLSSEWTGSVRGEVLLSRDNLKKYYPEAKNCRNQAVGLMKRKDGEGCEHLDIVCYDAVPLEGFMSAQSEIHEFLTSNKFKTAEQKVFDKVDGKIALSYLEKVWKDWDKLEYDIDGLVWKMNDIDSKDLEENARPKTQIALKPARTKVKTVVIGFDWHQTGSTFTPVALLKPVNLLGATISRASCANVARLEYLGLEIGHEVEILRGGEIIPVLVADLTTGKFLKKYAA